MVKSVLHELDKTEYGHMLLAEYARYQETLKLERQQEWERKLNHAKQQVGILDQKAAREREEKVKEQERFDKEQREAEKIKVEEEERQQKLQKEKEWVYYQKV